MANSSIYEKIENKGAVEAQKIKDAGVEQANLQRQEKLDAANRDIEILIQKTISSNNEKIKTKVTQFEQDAKKSTLLNKKKLIDDVFNISLSKLQELDNKDLFQFVLNLLKADELNGDEVLKVSKTDYDKYMKVFSTSKKADKEIELDLLNSSLGKNHQLKLSNEPVEINGGFVVIGKSFDINHSYVAILNQVREANEPQIAKLLFGKGN